jgi:hypothetical protein
MNDRTSAGALNGSPLCHLILLEILGLFEDFFVDLVAVDGRLAVFGQKDNEIHFQLGFGVVALAPIGVFGFVVNHLLYGFG